jgi:hypothetical protein
VTRLCEVAGCDRRDAEPFQACGTYYVCLPCRVEIESMSAELREEEW